MISHNFIALKEGEYPTVILSNDSMKVLKGQEKVVFKEFIKVNKISENNEMFETLRTLRKEMATDAGVPPYFIFPDSTLKEMSLRYPLNKEQIFEISGVGQVKYERYGEKFLGVINDYVIKNNIEVNWTEKTEAKVTRTTKTSSNKEKTHDITMNMLKEGQGIKEIAKTRGLTINTILSHIEKYFKEGNIEKLEINFDEFFTEEEEKEIILVADEFGIDSIGLIKAKVSPKIGYDAIRSVIIKNYVLDRN